MRSNFLKAALFTLIIAFPLLPRAVFADAASEQVCYCRYKNGAPLSEPEELQYCPGEVGAIGTVPRGQFAPAACVTLCGNAGLDYVSINNVDPTGFSNAYTPVVAEKNYCVFSHARFDGAGPTSIPNWSESNNNCGTPLNSIIYSDNLKGNIPSACSYCFCKFKTGAPPASCAGKTTWIHAMGVAANCPALCIAKGLDPAGDAVRNYNDHCNYKPTDGCTKPLNGGGKCDEELGKLQAVQDAAAFQAGHGTPLSLLLPLGDLSVSNLIGRVIRQILSVVGALALVFFIWGGLKYMTAAGDEKKVKEARDMIVAAVSGLAAIFLSYAVLTLLINALN